MSQERHEQVRHEQARRIAAAQKRLRQGEPRESAIRTEAERRIAAGILVDGAPFAPAGADFLRIADHVGDYKTTPAAGGTVVELRVGGRLFTLELRDLDAAAARLSDYSETVSAAADAAIFAGAEPDWPARPNLKTEPGGSS